MRTSDNHYILDIRFQPKKHKELCDLILQKSNIWLKATQLVSVDEDRDDDNEKEIDKSIKKCFTIFHTIEYEDDKFKYRISLDYPDWDEINYLDECDDLRELDSSIFKYIKGATPVIREDLIHDNNLDFDIDDSYIQYYVNSELLYNIDDITNHLIQLSKRLGV